MRRRLDCLYLHARLRPAGHLFTLTCSVCTDGSRHAARRCDSRPHPGAVCAVGAVHPVLWHPDALPGAPGRGLGEVQPGVWTQILHRCVLVQKPHTCRRMHAGDPHNSMEGTAAPSLGYCGPMLQAHSVSSGRWTTRARSSISHGSEAWATGSHLADEMTRSIQAAALDNLLCS